MKTLTCQNSPAPARIASRPRHRRRHGWTDVGPGAQGLSRTGYVAIADATFEVADGELLVLVGPSGCGKSTLLRMIAGLESITSGTLRIGERVVNDVAPKDRDIAMVFQSYALYPHMTVAENLGFGLKLRGHSHDARSPRACTKPRRCSSWRRCSTASPRRCRAVSASASRSGVRWCASRRCSCSTSRCPISTPSCAVDARRDRAPAPPARRDHGLRHPRPDRGDDARPAHRRAASDGRIQQIDTPMALYERPANLFVATFLGSPAMNVLTGRLVRADGLALDLGDGLRLPLGAARGRRSRGWNARSTVGIRPEDLQPAAAGSATAFAPDVEVVEPVGNEVFVNLRAGCAGAGRQAQPAGAAGGRRAAGPRAARPKLHVLRSGLRAPAGRGGLTRAGRQARYTRAGNGGICAI